MNEMPVDTPEQRWAIDDAELLYRRDIRKSHLVFTYDPAHDYIAAQSAT